MKRPAAKKTTEMDKIEKSLMVETAKKQFFSATFNMGWRLAVTVVVPVVLGVKIDASYNTAPSFTLLGVIVAAVAGSMVVWSTVKEVNEEQAEEEMKRKKRGNNAE